MTEKIKIINLITMVKTEGLAFPIILYLGQIDQLGTVSAGCTLAEC